VKGFLPGKDKDFGPALAAEKLVDLEGIAVSRETVRRFRSNSGFGNRSGGVLSGCFKCASGVRASAS